MPTSASGIINFFMTGHEPMSSGLDLYMHGYTQATSDITFFMKGPIQETNSLNIFIDNPRNTVSGNLDLFITGASSGSNYDFNTISLYLQGDVLTSSLPLFLNNTDPAIPTSTNEDLNLYLNGQGFRQNKDLPLIIEPGGSFGKYTTGDISLFIAGKGILRNAVPSETYLNMYINTGLGAESGINLYINSCNPHPNYIYMYTAGVSGYKASGLNMFIESQDVINKTLTIFTRGYE